MKFSPETERTWQFRARPYGTAGFAETIEAVRGYTMADVAGKITTPLLITGPEGEKFWPGQANQIGSLTDSVSTIIHLTATEGASEHCQPLARTLTAQRIFDWLDEHIGASRSSRTPTPFGRAPARITGPDGRSTMDVDLAARWPIRFGAVRTDPRPRVARDSK